MRKVVKFIPALMLLLLAGCEKDFYIEEQQTGKRMVVNCVFDNYRPFRVFVTESALLSGPGDPILLTDAQVRIYEDGNLREELRYIPSDTMGIFGSFQSSFVAQPGKRYAVEVVHPVYGTVNATDVLLPQPNVISTTLMDAPNPNTGYSWLANMRFTDNPAETNYYRLSIWMDWSTLAVDPITGDTLRYQNTNGPRPIIFSQLQDTTRDNGWQLLFSDKGFNGQMKDLQFGFAGLDTAGIEHGNYYLELSAVSREHYEYFRTLELYRLTNSGNNEPVEVFTNIKGGYGIFAGQSIKSFFVPLK